MIALKNITKIFKLPHQRRRTLYHRLVSIVKRQYDFESLYALRDISLTVNDGEFFGIIGRNGSGKSTLLKVISKIYRPTAGELSVGGQVFPMLELGIGFQQEFSCRENVFLQGVVLGFSRKEIVKRFDEIIAFAELERFVDAKLGTLSTGMLMKLGFAIAVQSDAPILLVDEAFAVGDLMFSAKCEQKFSQFRAEGKTVILVSHDLEAVRKFCSRVIVLRDGQIINEGDAAAMISWYRKSLQKPRGYDD
jgi:ABC-type polysaccharide/polyol phosphate transport system ATPase subunit